MNASALQRLTLENALRRALERSEFELHYQPIVNGATGLPIGAEALVRGGTREETGSGARCATTSSRAGTSTSCPTAATTTTSTTARRSARPSRPGGSRERSRSRGRPTVLERYRVLAPDCMGRWVVDRRQNMPGLGQHRARRRRPPDEELVAVPLLLVEPAHDQHDDADKDGQRDDLDQQRNRRAGVLGRPPQGRRTGACPRRRATRVQSTVLLRRMGQTLLAGSSRE